MRTKCLKGFGLIFLSLLAAHPVRAAEPNSSTLHLESAAFKEGGAIPTAYTCKGANISPPLAWTGVPANAKSLAFIVDDPDAPDPAAPKKTVVHWVLFDLSPETKELPENASSALPPGAHQGANDMDNHNYHGPCPPIGRHRYMFKFFALDTAPELAEGSTKAQLEQAMHGHILMQTVLIGTYAVDEK